VQAEWFAAEKQHTEPVSLLEKKAQRDLLRGRMQKWRAVARVCVLAKKDRTNSGEKKEKRPIEEGTAIIRINGHQFSNGYEAQWAAPFDTIDKMRLVLAKPLTASRPLDNAAECAGKVVLARVGIVGSVLAQAKRVEESGAAALILVAAPSMNIDAASGRVHSDVDSHKQRLRRVQEEFARSGVLWSINLSQAAVVADSAGVGSEQVEEPRVNIPVLLFVDHMMSTLARDMRRRSNPDGFESSEGGKREEHVSSKSSLKSTGLLRSVAEPIHEVELVRLGSGQVQAIGVRMAKWRALAQVCRLRSQQQPAFSVQVFDLGGNSTPIEVRSFTRVADLKRMISEATGVPRDFRQKLYSEMSEEPLKTSNTVHECGLTEGSSVYLLRSTPQWNASAVVHGRRVLEL
jgi:hypothetical protein